MKYARQAWESARRARCVSLWFPEHKLAPPALRWHKSCRCAWAGECGEIAKKVGLVHGTSDCKMLIVSGCTSVYPYKEDVKLWDAKPGLCRGVDGFWIENCNFRA